MHDSLDPLAHGGADHSHAKASEHQEAVWGGDPLKWTLAGQKAEGQLFCLLEDAPGLLEYSWVQAALLVQPNGFDGAARIMADAAVLCKPKTLVWKALWYYLGPLQLCSH